MKHFAGDRTPATRRRVAQSAQAGIALIEALVSTLIFSFGLLGLIGLAARAATFSASAEDRNRASVFANEVASKMWTQKSVTIDAATLATYNSAIGNPAQGGLLNGKVAVSAVSSNSADITITWQPASNTNADTSKTISNTLTTRVTLP